MRNHHTSIERATIEIVTIPDIVKNVEKLDLSYIISGNVNWYTLEKTMAIC